MERSTLKRLLCGLLTVIMLMGTFSTFTFAEEPAKTEGQTEEKKSELEVIKELLNAASYTDYIANLGDVKKADKGFTVNLAETYDKKNAKSDAEVEIMEEYQGKKGKFVVLPVEGTAAFKINVPADGMYGMKITYCAYDKNSKATSIERMFYLDGKVPFAEARYVEMPKTWIDLVEEDNGQDDYYPFKLDLTDNDIRPEKKEVPTWSTYTLSDSTGFVVEPLQVYLTKGEHVIAFEAVREAVVIENVEFYAPKDLPTYEEYIADCNKKGYKQGTESLRFEAETPKTASDQTIYPLNDRTSPITYPQDASKVKLNTIGSDKWETVGQWIEYEIDIEESGMYEIAARFKQDVLAGMYVSRRIYINGEVPFKEANSIEFNYSDTWQSGLLGTKDTGYKFYFEKGKNTIRFEVVLGSMSELLSRVNDDLSLMNSSYLKIMMITGSSPDEFRDYDFGRLVPDAINNLIAARDDLKAVSSELEAITGQKGSHVATLDKVVVLLERMTSNESEIAKNLENLKTYIGTLGTWLLDSRNQPLELDYLVIQPEGSELPEADAGFFKSLAFEFKAFILSFFTDYSTLGATQAIDENKKVTVWTTVGREKSKIMRQCIDTDFMPKYNISVELKLVSGGILQSTLAGIGPDVAFLASADCVNYAIRDAVLPLNDMEGFDEAMKRFPTSSTTPLTLYGTTYGLPNTSSFLMMFYRMDILAELGIEVPKTWDDLKNLIPILQNNNMTIGFPSKLSGTRLFLYQMGGEMYADEGKRINLSSNTALSAFTELTDLFQSYKFPLTYDFPNRFRTGEIPIGIVDYITNYNQLTVFAPEIDGLWEFAPLPGFEDENGNINNSTVVTVEAIALMKGAEDNKEDAWQFINWFTSTDAQVKYSNELVAVVGQCSKRSTANTEALAELPWSAREYKNLKAQFDKTVGIPEYPGGYIISRYVDFAFMEVYNKGTNAVEAMLDNVTEINKEITRKRKEFGFAYLEISYSDSSQYIEEAK